jgi:hypothetical protein
MKYRKKPVVIEAWRVPANGQLTEPAPTWLIDAVLKQAAVPDRDSGTISIKTLEGEMLANVGDWIIQGVKGELYPCKNEIFEATYTPETSGEPK